MATGQQGRDERLQQRLRGAQRTNIQDESFNLDFNLDLAGLNIASSTPAAPKPVPPTSSANTSAKRRRLDTEPPPSASAQGSARRRSPRIRSDDPYELPDTSKESGAQDTSAEAAEVEESVDDAAEETEIEPESEPEPEPEPELPSPQQSIEAPEENEVDIELPVLPNGNVSTSPDARPSSQRTQENDQSPDEPQIMQIDAVSSTTRLHAALAEEDDVPASSSPLVSKLRRSGGHSMSRSRVSQGRASRATELSLDADELSPERPVQAPADDELSEDNQIEDEPADITIEPAEDEPEELEEPEESREPEEEVDTQDEEEEEEDAVADAINAVEAAKALGKKRPRRGLPSQSPEAEPEEQAEEEPTPKRRRGQSSRSPATQKQPATKPKPSTKSRTGPKPLPKQVRKTKQAEKARRVSDGSAIEITVQRFVNVKKYGKDDGEEDQLAGDAPFIMNGETVVDVFSQVCFEVIDGVVARLYDTLGNTEEKEKKKECRIKILALEAYKEELTSRLLQQAIHLNDLNTLRKRVRIVQREKLSLREEILRLKAEKEQVALKMDAVRIKHEEDTKESKYRLDTSAIMHDIDMAVERGRDAPELSRAQEKKADLANLELLVARITDEASSASSAGGMLQQVKNFNAFLERAAVALETKGR
ncbi:hypothetical protein FLAG1_05039 [Fusarium langsethiae]|uniref:Inner kinetochore subunit AME1 domain-containing protein n=1 Tax=Fusarium langsethiae TaxID=179993 RepID=A0A0M9EY11_FUSLA|nr:hypothetical protein FLAG1_05039 [Fusarium langsethiae]